MSILGLTFTFICTSVQHAEKKQLRSIIYNGHQELVRTSILHRTSTISVI